MIALGLDIGGTKIEARKYGSEWSLIESKRDPTPRDYPELISVISEQIRWGCENMSVLVPIGISSAGYSNPTSGKFYAVNLPAFNQPFLADIIDSIGQPVTLINDARAFVQSEAVFGAAKNDRIVVGITLGTGIGGGIVIDKKLHHGIDNISGEFGHLAAPASIVTQWGLPIEQCNCGRYGCIETLASGPGLKRICKTITGRNIETPEIAASRHSSDEINQVWRIWCAIVAELLVSLTLSVEPDVFVLGGGMSQVPGLAEDITNAMAELHFVKELSPKILIAEGGDASGARGAAFAAWQAVNTRP